MRRLTTILLILALLLTACGSGGKMGSSGGTGAKPAAGPSLAGKRNLNPSKFDMDMVMEHGMGYYLGLDPKEPTDPFPYKVDLNEDVPADDWLGGVWYLVWRSRSAAWEGEMLMATEGYSMLQNHVWPEAQKRGFSNAEIAKRVGATPCETAIEYYKVYDIGTLPQTGSTDRGLVLVGYEAMAKACGEQKAQEVGAAWEQRVVQDLFQWYAGARESLVRAKSRQDMPEVSRYYESMLRMWDWFAGYGVLDEAARRYGDYCALAEDADTHFKANVPRDEYPGLVYDFYIGCWRERKLPSQRGAGTAAPGGATRPAPAAPATPPAPSSAPPAKAPTQTPNDKPSAPPAGTPVAQAPLPRRATDAELARALYWFIHDYPAVQRGEGGELVQHIYGNSPQTHKMFVEQAAPYAAVILPEAYGPLPAYEPFFRQYIFRRKPGKVGDTLKASIFEKVIPNGGNKTYGYMLGDVYPGEPLGANPPARVEFSVK